MQDKKERVGIRTAYRNLLHDTNRNKDEFLSSETGRSKLQETLHQANEIFSQVRMPREAAMDSQLMAVLAGFGVQHAKSLRTEFVVFQSIEFAQKLMGFLQVSQLQDQARSSIPDESWAALGRVADPYFRKAPILTYMFGAFVRGAPKKKQRRKIEKDVQTKNAVIPKQVMNIENGQQKEKTTHEVEQVLAALFILYSKWGNNPVCYFEFVVNSESFGRTVENIFYMSFLIRDGHVRIFLDDDRLPVIEPVILQDKDGVALPADYPRNQVVISITKADWREIITAFDIKKSLIPMRLPIQE